MCYMNIKCDSADLREKFGKVVRSKGLSATRAINVLMTSVVAGDVKVSGPAVETERNEDMKMPSDPRKRQALKQAIKKLVASGGAGNDFFDTLVAAGFSPKEAVEVRLHIDTHLPQVLRS